MPKLDHPVIGILGGMGPEATVEFMRRIIRATPARDDSDHIHMIVDNNPKIPSRIAALIDGTGESPVFELIRMAKGLERAGATVLVMPCNTAHAYAGDIRSAVTIPFLDMIALTVSHVSNMPLPRRRIGLLASSAVVKLALYIKQLEAEGVVCVLPDEQAALMSIIKAVKAGDTGNNVRRNFTRIAASLSSKGVDVLVIACTELSVLAESLDSGFSVCDALNILRDAALRAGLRDWP